MSRDIRKVELKARIAKVELPQFCYLALCNSTDKWSSIVGLLPEEVHAFSTKARCPALVFFEMEDHPMGTDVATFLSNEMADLMPNKKNKDENKNEGVRTIGLEGKRSSIYTNGFSSISEGGESSDQSIPPSPARRTTSTFQKLDKVTARARRSSVAGNPECFVAFQDENGNGVDKKLDSDSGDSDEDEDILAHNASRLSHASVKLEFIPMDHSNVTGEYNDTTGHDEGDGEDANEDQDNITPEVTGKIETFGEKSQRLRSSSPRGHLPGWRLDGLIAKSNDDLRQEVCRVCV
jgi:hypothetical protein